MGIKPHDGASDPSSATVTGPTGCDRGRSRRCATSRAPRVSPRAPCRASSTTHRPGSHRGRHSRTRPRRFAPARLSPEPPRPEPARRLDDAHRRDRARLSATGSSRRRSRRWPWRRWRAATTSSSATPTAGSTRGSRLTSVLETRDTDAIVMLGDMQDQPRLLEDLRDSSVPVVATWQGTSPLEFPTVDVDEQGRHRRGTRPSHRPRPPADRLRQRAPAGRQLAAPERVHRCRRARRCSASIHWRCRSRCSRSSMRDTTQMSITFATVSPRA